MPQSKARAPVTRPTVPGPESVRRPAKRSRPPVPAQYLRNPKRESSYSNKGDGLTPGNETTAVRINSPPIRTM